MVPSSRSSRGRTGGAEGASPARTLQHRARSTHWYRQHHLHTAPMAPTAPPALWLQPHGPRGTPRASKSLLLCPPGCGPTCVPAVPMAMFPVSPCPCTPCSPVPRAPQPCPPCPHGHVPSVPQFCAPSFVPPRCRWSPPHVTLPRTLGASNPSARRKPRARHRVGGTPDSGCHHRGHWLCPLSSLWRHWQGQVLCPFIVASTIIFLCPGCSKAETPVGTGPL